MPAGGGDISKCPVKGGQSPSAAIWAKAAAGASSPTAADAGGAGAVSAAAGVHATTSGAASPAACPVKPGSGGTGGPAGRGPVYNVYAQVIDTTNNMPAAANQQPSPGQKAALSTQRVQSSISKGGTDSTWLYPSPQMFWNALVRKGKEDGVQETEVDMVVAIHNEMNERTWRQLQGWEALHKG
jgi:cytochrome c heme-lyase